MKTIVDEIIAAFKSCGTITGVCEKVGCSHHRVKKILSSNGIVINDTHYLILKYAEEGKTPEEISKMTGLSVKTVNAYLPAVRPYYLVNPSENAKRVERSKQRKKNGEGNPNNTSGSAGVVFINKKWAALINYKSKRYWLGTYGKKEDAVKAREEAEGHLGDNFQRWYEKEYPLVNKRRIKK